VDVLALGDAGVGMPEHDAAARGEPGSRKRLAELQRHYREGRHLIDRYPAGATARLVGSSTATSLRPRRVKQQAQRKTRRAISRTQDTPYWLLVREPEPWRLR
jgi:hypothetical protein